LLDFDEAIRLEPDFAPAHFNRGMAYCTLGRFAAAIDDFTTSLRLVPDLDRALFQRGRAYQSLREYALATADLRAAVKLKPADARYHNQLAWLLATCPDDQYRDGAAALSHAEHACDLSDGTDAVILDTRAVAHAECGDFAGAVQWVEAALALATPDVKDVLGERLKLFRSGKPCRDHGS
jgi:tetratricopeptide (TPR) repeat protein